MSPETARRLTRNEALERIAEPVVCGVGPAPHEHVGALVVDVDLHLAHGERVVEAVRQRHPDRDRAEVVHFEAGDLHVRLYVHDRVGAVGGRRW